MRAIDEWRHAWRMFSVQAMALAAAVQGAWISFDDGLKQYVPHWLVTALTIGLLAAGIGGRLVKQKTSDPRSLAKP